MKRYRLEIRLVDLNPGTGGLLFSRIGEPLDVADVQRIVNDAINAMPDKATSNEQPTSFPKTGSIPFFGSHDISGPGH